jgi:hypothetical protein
VAAKLLERRSLPRLAEAQRRRDEREDGVGVGRADEVDEVDPVGEPVDLVRSSPDPEARLAAAAGAGQRDEADILVVEALADRAELSVAADEG